MYLYWYNKLVFKYVSFVFLFMFVVFLLHVMLLVKRLVCVKKRQTLKFFILVLTIWLEKKTCAVYFE